eukprot:m.207187 g.207187  ORF g.207187 m.207187 type:complete len:316 (+) comp23620_c0_seq1:359-1306(+)
MGDRRDGSTIPHRSATRFAAIATALLCVCRVGELSLSELPVLLPERLSDGILRIMVGVAFPARSPWPLLDEQRCKGECGRAVVSLTGRHPAALMRRRAAAAALACKDAVRPAAACPLPPRLGATAGPALDASLAAGEGVAPNTLESSSMPQSETTVCEWLGLDAPAGVFMVPNADDIRLVSTVSRSCSASLSEKASTDVVDRIRCTRKFKTSALCGDPRWDDPDDPMDSRRSCRWCTDGVEGGEMPRIECGEPWLERSWTSDQSTASFSIKSGASRGMSMPASLSASWPSCVCMTDGVLRQPPSFPPSLTERWVL